MVEREVLAVLVDCLVVSELVEPVEPEVSLGQLEYSISDDLSDTMMEPYFYFLILPIMLLELQVLVVLVGNEELELRVMQALISVMDDPGELGERLLQLVRVVLRMVVDL